MTRILGLVMRATTWIGDVTEVLIGAIIPTFRHIDRLAGIIDGLKRIGLPVLIVDDGNLSDAAAAIAKLADPHAGVFVERRVSNGGKGAAMKAGFRRALGLGWTHALQVDADGQHDLEAAARMLELAAQHPDAVICGVPIYDATVPLVRKFGRRLTHACVWAETMSREISDSMCGFRIYPLREAVRAINREFIGDRMDFDTEILVQLNWRGLRTIEHPIRVTYPLGNLSNFRMVRDNIRMTLLHLRLLVQTPFRVPLRAWRRVAPGL